MSDQKVRVSFRRGSVYVGEVLLPPSEVEKLKAVAETKGMYEIKARNRIVRVLTVTAHDPVAIPVWYRVDVD